MDSSIKACISVFFSFLAMFSLICIVTFFIKYNQLTTRLYAIVQEIEMSDKRSFSDTKYTFDDVSVEITPIESLYGQQYNVSLYFNHLFGFTNTKRRFTVSSLTRMFEY